jgi:hypothetical protein
MSWQDILKEEDEWIDEYRYHVKQWAEQADKINTYAEMHELYKGMKEMLDEYMFQLTSMQKPKPEEGFSDREARPEFAREVDNQRL